MTRHGAIVDDLSFSFLPNGKSWEWPGIVQSLMAYLCSSFQMPRSVPDCMGQVFTEAIRKAIIDLLDVPSSLTNDWHVLAVMLELPWWASKKLVTVLPYCRVWFIFLPFEDLREVIIEVFCWISLSVTVTDREVLILSMSHQRSSWNFCYLVPLKSPNPNIASYHDFLTLLCYSVARSPFPPLVS